MTSLYNFYLDDELKQQVTEKLEKCAGKKEKGQLASLIRVQLKVFLAKEPSKELIDAISTEYEYTTRKNKRSKM